MPDGVERVTLSVAGDTRPASRSVENVFETQLDAIRGTEVELAMQRSDGCRRAVAPELLAATPVLREPDQPTLVLPAAALGALRDWPIEAVVEDGARFWGGTEDVDFWVVPVVPGGQERCAPATRVCVVAVPGAARADAQCVLARDPGDEVWRVGPLLPDSAAIYGVVPEGVSRARVTIGDVTGDVEARGGVVAGVLPFPYERGAQQRVELLR